jgi:hypothetical protein
VPLQRRCVGCNQDATPSGSASIEQSNARSHLYHDTYYTSHYQHLVRVICPPCLPVDTQSVRRAGNGSARQLGFVPVRQPVQSAQAANVRRGPSRPPLLWCVTSGLIAVVHCTGRMNPWGWLKYAQRYSFLQSGSRLDIAIHAPCATYNRQFTWASSVYPVMPAGLTLAAASVLADKQLS